MISNKVYRAKNETPAPFGVVIKKDDELHIVQDVVYFNGFPLPPEMQNQFYNWLVTNNNFYDDTRDF
jgi:hypothetical protein